MIQMRGILILLFGLVHAATAVARDSPEAIRTATALMRDIGESAASDPISIEEAASVPEKSSILSSSSIIGGNDNILSSHHIPHYSLFAPSSGDALMKNAANAASMDGSSEVRFQAASLQLQSATSEGLAASTSKSSSSSTNPSRGDVVGSFTVIFEKAGAARGIASRSRALQALVQLTKRALLSLINPNGENNQTSSMTIYSHMVEVDVSFPTFLLKKQKEDMQTNLTLLSRMRELTVNVALRGLSLVQDQAAINELNGIDSKQRLLELYRSKNVPSESKDGEQGDVLAVLPTSVTNNTKFGVVPTKVGFSVGCPLLCGGKGQCSGVTGECQCFSGFMGADCSIITCTQDCGPHGRCNNINRTCDCDKTHVGDTCQHEINPNGDILCPNDCSSRGFCNQTSGSCDCAEHWDGEDCTTPVCPEDCAGHGNCVVVMDKELGGPTPSCECEADWSGDWCASPACPIGENGFQCSSNAIGCVNRTCHCRPGYEGEDCGQESCPNGCSNHGEVSIIVFVNVIIIYSMSSFLFVTLLLMLVVAYFFSFHITFF